MSNLINLAEEKRIKVYLKNIIKYYNYDELECELRAGQSSFLFGGDSNAINLSQFRNLESFMDKLSVDKKSKTSLDISIKHSITNPRISNLRFSLYGEDNISQYCKTNRLPQLTKWLRESKTNKPANFNKLLDIMYKGSLDWISEDEEDQEAIASIGVSADKSNHNRANIDVESIRTRFGGKVEMNYNFLEKGFITDISNLYLKKMKEHATSAYGDVLKMDFEQLSKMYRLKQRISYKIEIDGIIFTIDLTKVKTSKLDHNKQLVSSLNIINSELSTQDETYEYETEFKLYNTSKTVDECYEVILKFLDTIYIKSLEYIGITNIYTSKIDENKVLEIYKKVVASLLEDRINNKLESIKDLKRYNVLQSGKQTKEAVQETSDINNKYENPYSYYNLLKKTTTHKLEQLIETHTKTLSNLTSRKGDFRNNSAFYLSPKVISIDLHNIRSENAEAITHDYTVTDKADGYNMLLFQIGEDADNDDYKNKLFLIDSNMIVYTTNIKAKSSKGSFIFNGEYLPVDFKGNTLNKYAIFDCYLNNGIDVCLLPLMNESDDVETRLKIVDNYIITNRELVKVIIHQLTDSLKHTTLESTALIKGTELLFAKDYSGIAKGTKVKILAIDYGDDEAGADETKAGAGLVTKTDRDVDYIIKAEGHDAIVVGREHLITEEEDLHKGLEIRENNSQFGIFVKEFYIGSDKNIFEHSNKIWNNWESKKVNTTINSRYYLDGLIYTPASLPVGYITNKYDYDLKQNTGWNLNLKWKPPHDNTIDFLVKFDKETIATRGSTKVTRNKIIKKAFIKGGETSYKEYISAKLYNGGNKKIHRNPCDFKQTIRNNIFEPVLFEPSHPVEKDICNILIPVTNLRKGYTIKKIPKDIDDNIIDDNTIVEVSYNNFVLGIDGYEPLPNLRWKILRTRHDKTFNYKSGLNEQKRQYLQIHKCIDIVNKYDSESEIKIHELTHLEKNIKRIKNDLRIKNRASDFQIIKQNIPNMRSYYTTPSIFKVSINYGNHSSVADNIWKTIHNPITEEMISTGNNIPSITQEEEKYYKRDQRRDKSITLNLQNFHNKIIKNRVLIQNACTYLRNNNINNISLLDLACGKGGDIPKWRDNNIKTVVGIDYIHNNIDDPKDGACSRYNFYKLQAEKSAKSIPKTYFLVGDAGKSILQGQSVTDSRYSSLQYDLWNTDIYSNTNFANSKFDIISVMFAAHYFFKSESILDDFISNINDNIKEGGLLIGCCFDGKAIFDKLQKLPINGYIEGTLRGAAIWRIKKKYNISEFSDDSSSLGQSIDVLIYSIGQIIEEYLVNFEYLKKKLEEINVVPLTSEELSKMNWIPNNESVGSFETIFKHMKSISTDSPLYKLANDMKLGNEEKTLSFLFKYFIFKKKTTEENKLVLLENYIYNTTKLRKLLNPPTFKRLKDILLVEDIYTDDLIDTAISNMRDKYVKQVQLEKKESLDAKHKKVTVSDDLFQEQAEDLYVEAKELEEESKKDPDDGSKKEPEMDSEKELEEEFKKESEEESKKELEEESEEESKKELEKTKKLKGISIASQMTKSHASSRSRVKLKIHRPKTELDKLEDLLNKLLKSKASEADNTEVTEAISFALVNYKERNPDQTKQVDQLLKKLKK